MCKPLPLDLVLGSGPHWCNWNHIGLNKVVLFKVLFYGDNYVSPIFKNFFQAQHELPNPKVLQISDSISSDQMQDIDSLIRIAHLRVAPPVGKSDWFDDGDDDDVDDDDDDDD